MNVLDDVDSSLGNISSITSCKIMYSPDSEEVEVALSGNTSGITNLIEVTQYIQKPIKIDAFQEGSQFEYIVNQFIKIG